MIMDKYEPNELFIYTRDGDCQHIELGMVKGPNNTGDGYFCWYSRGDTAANTPTRCMRKLANAGYTRVEALLEVHTYTNREWAQFGHDLSLFERAYNDYKYNGTGVHCAELAEHFEDVEYVLRMPYVDIVNRAISYGLDEHLFTMLCELDWRSLVDDWRDEDAEE